jgi:hypothetical protein
MIERTVSLREAHRCIKIWRALWRKLAALGYCVRDADPALGITNRAAKGAPPCGPRARWCGSPSAHGATAIMASRQ